MKCKKCGGKRSTATRGPAGTARLRGLCYPCLKAERNATVPAQKKAPLGATRAAPIGRAFRELEKSMTDLDKMLSGLVGDSEELLVRARRLAHEVNERIGHGRSMIERIEASVREANAELRRQAAHGFSLRADVQKAKNALPGVPQGHRFDKDGLKPKSH